MDTLMIWAGFVAVFAVMLYGAEKSFLKKPKYVRVNKYTSDYAKYIPVR